jgi:DHA1 family bicyclomycin/chloramphenicol resistance-like MFS transporter
MLAALATLGPFSIDAYLPAFAGIQASLDATPLEIQQTLSAYLFAFGLMFLFHGALSDSFGRRPVILVALVVYTIASRRGARRPGTGSSCGASSRDCRSARHGRGAAR